MNRYRGVILRVGAIIAVVLLVVIGVRYLIGGGPDEKYRVAHSAGYSVIRPREWKATMINTPDSDGFRDSILLAPEHWIGLEPLLWVKRYGVTPDFENLQSIGFSGGTFQGQAAWVSEQRLKRNLVRTVVFRRGGDWFNLGARLPGVESAKMEDWWRFIESFRPASGVPSTSNAIPVR